MEKRLSELLAYLPDDAILAVHGDVAITAPVVETDADVREGGIFVARRGASVDGHTFIPKAIERGAAAIVGEANIRDLPIPYVQVRDARAILGLLAAAFFDFPSRELIVIGVTGTDGKTTTSHLLHSILKQAKGVHPGLISTIEADLGGATIPTGLHVTTPGAPQVQSLLAQMVANGVTHCVLEMTSHGLAQGRLTGVDIDVAVMTNITHEHLDFHGSWEAYRDAKAIMFHMLKASHYKSDQPKVAVVNADDRSAAYFAAIPADETLLYGIEAEATFRPVAIEHAPDATRFTVNGHQFAMHLVGEFNIYNALAAIAAARGLGIDWGAIIDGVEAVRGVSGRMERIDEGQDFTAIVDFAHTPNALRRALEAGRAMLPQGGRLIAVFGSAGLRDVEKRCLMAETSAQLADITVLTAEDPRTESLDDILQMMADGCLAHGGVEGETFFRIPDRGEAIYQACQMAKAGDIVMVCGKGHEQSMCFGVTEYPWDDRAALRAALRGQPLRTLPTSNFER